MGVPESTSQDDEAGRFGRPNPAAPVDAPTQQLVAGTVGDRCSNCGVPMVSDQHYCLNCGERRGRARFSFNQLANQQPAPSVPPASRRLRPTSGATLVGGIATLLIAMGVGVLIGHDSNTGARQAAAVAPQVITVNGGGGATTTAATGGSGATHRGANVDHAKGAATKAKKVVVTKKVATAANAAAATILGGNSNLAPPTAQVGGSCSHGAGCQNGKFTGNFFGGG